jgi:Ca2+-binding EF-hand superfamily protein
VSGGVSNFKMREEDWQKLRQKAQTLPTNTMAEMKQAREDLFDEFDESHESYLSEPELQAGLVEHLELEQGMRQSVTEPTVREAMAATKKFATDAQNMYGKTFDSPILKNKISKEEFRYFLLSVRMYFEFQSFFQTIDKDDDNEVSKKEFTDCRQNLERWVGPIMDIDQRFKEIDHDRSGVINFTEFFKWAADIAL